MSKIIYLQLTMETRMTEARFLVTGATGKTGGAVVAQLRRQGCTVRALVRRDDARRRALAATGVETVVADPLDPVAMRAALIGIDRAYYLPPFHPTMLEAATVFAGAARESGLGSIVALSQWLASPAHPAWLTRQLWAMEQAFAALPAALTIVAPPLFADNYLRLIGFAAHLGVLPSLTGNSRNAPPSTEDIAAVAVAALLDPAAHAGRRYCPTGPELLSTADMAAILTRVLGRKVRRVEMPMWLFLKAARMQGVSPEELSGFRHWVRDHRDGAFSYGLPTDDVRTVTGCAPEPYETIARRYATLPEARRSPGSDAKAVLDFMLTPMMPGYNLDRFDGTLGLAAPAGPLRAMHNPAWRVERSPATRRGAGATPVTLGEAA